MLRCPTCYLWITDQLPVQLRVEGLHVQTVDIEHRIADDTDLVTNRERT